MHLICRAWVGVDQGGDDLAWSGCRGAACLSGHDLVLLSVRNWPGSSSRRLVPPLGTRKNTARGVDAGGQIAASTPVADSLPPQGQDDNNDDHDKNDRPDTDIHG
jgi:hypothetical protein